MKILETIIASSIVGLIISMVSIYAAKRMLKSEKEAIFDEILAYLSTLEGQQSVRNLGTIFAQGISKGIGLGGSPLKGKTFGIPNAVLVRILDRYLPERGKKAISEENVESTSGKFG